MRPRHFLFTNLIGAVSAVLLMLLASCSRPPPSASANILSTPVVRDALVEDAADQDDAGALASPGADSLASKTDPTQDGLALLKTRCVRCHVITWFDKIEKSRDELAEALERMEAMNVRLSDAEKDILLDYLAGADEP